MPIRLLFVGDQHMDSVAPSSRKDDYFESLKLKFQEIQEIAKDRDVVGIVWLGDLYHKQDAHRVPYFVTNWLMKYFMESKFTNYLVMGNHDVKANAQNWRRQPLGTLVEAGVVIPLWSDVTDANPMGVRTYDLLGSSTHITLTGKQFSYEADKPENRRAYYKREDVPRKQGDTQPFSVMACHTTVVPDGENFFGHYSNPKDIEEALAGTPGADLYLLGHLHDFYGSFGNKLRFANFGSLARGSIDEYNIKRKVKVGYLEVTKNGDDHHVKLEEIDLKCMKPAEDIFYVEEFSRKKKRTEELDKLASMLNAGTLADEFRIINAEESLEIVLRAKKVRPGVEKVVREHVKLAKVELDL